MNIRDILNNQIKNMYRESLSRLPFVFNPQSNNSIYSYDGKFLGSIKGRFDPDSIFNRFGTYGSRFSQYSIFNRFGTYGSKFSQYSPFNKFSLTPPKLVINGEFKGFLTMNKYLSHAIAVDVFLFEAASKLGLLDSLSDELSEMLSDVIY